MKLHRFLLVQPMMIIFLKHILSRANNFIGGRRTPPHPIHEPHPLLVISWLLLLQNNINRTHTATIPPSSYLFLVPCGRRGWRTFSRWWPYGSSHWFSSPRTWRRWRERAESGTVEAGSERNCDCWHKLPPLLVAACDRKHIITLLCLNIISALWILW